MNAPTTHDPAHDPRHAQPQRPARAHPPHSLLGASVLTRLGVAVLATGLLWLTVLWALD